MTQARIVLRDAALERGEQLLQITRLGSLTELINVMFSRYGRHLEETIANKPVHQPSPHACDVTLMQGCIEGAGVDWGIWDNDPELCEYIQACEDLSEYDIEGLIEALTSQIRSKTYASRLEEWEVVKPSW